MEPSKQKPFVKKTWDEFSAAGLLFVVNTFLQFFGWILMVQRNESGEIIDIFPCRTIWRGFKHQDYAEGHARVAKYLKENSDNLLNETTS